MDWVGKELSLAALTGVCTGVAVLIPMVNGSSWTGLWVPAFIGGPLGLIIGAAAVSGGHYAQRTTQHWPPNTLRRWRHRFAGCTTAAVTLLVSGLAVWAALAAGGFPSNSGGSPTLPVALAVVAAVSYLFAYALAPSPSA